MEARRTETTFCRICEALCGLEAVIENDKIVELRPDAKHVATGGYGCVKGLKQLGIYHSPDRLTHPLKRVGKDFVRISWDQALREIGEKVAAERAVHPDRIAMYVGTAAGFGVLHPAFAQGFMQGVGSKSMYSSSTQDCASKFAAAERLYGYPFTQPFPDLDRVQALYVVGANPAISKWAFLQVSNPIARLKELERRGAKLVFVDPRKTESAKVAGSHVFIRPDTDVFFYLAFLNEVLRREREEGGVVDHERVRRFMRGYGALEGVVQGWTPERCAEVTGIPAERLRELVADYLAADGAALYLSTGVNMGSHGALCFWLQEVINAITGNLDRPGGTLVGQGVMDFPAFGKKTGTLLRKDRSRVGNFKSTNDTFPGGILADEILTPGERQVRALFVTGGNPLLTMANAGRLKRAFSELELLVCLDIQMSETAHLAHYVLPCTSPFQRPDLPFIFPLMLGMQSKPYLQATRALEAPQGEQRDEATIYLGLARAAGAPLWGSWAAQRTFETMRDTATLTRKVRGKGGDLPALPQELLLSGLLRATGQGSFSKLAEEKHGRRRPPHGPGTFLGERVLTDDGKMDLAPSDLCQRAEEVLEGSFEKEREHAGLKLITRRSITTHNSWTHNHEPFVRERTNHLYMHPEDMQARDLEAGDLVDVTSATATVRLPVRALADLMPSVVALPHGWGHQHAKGMKTASQTSGVNVNLLAADGPDRINPISGMAQLTGIPVEVVKATGPQAHTWSGLPEQGAEAVPAAE
ncbi:MAG: molybdopterin-dependent oxidoreductase [Myxococcota bacterium]